MLAIPTKRRTRFDTRKFLLNTPPSNNEERIIERGEIAGTMYFVSRSNGYRGSIILTILTQEQQELDAFLTYVDDCLHIDDISYHDTMLKPAFLSRMIWLILAEAIECGAKKIEGHVQSNARVQLLLKSFSRYGFTAYYKDQHHHLLYELTNS